MRYWLWAVCAAAVVGLAGGAAGAPPKPEPPVTELPPTADDPFTDPIFNPPGVPKPVPVPPTKLPDLPPTTEPVVTPEVVKSLAEAGDWCDCASAGYTTWLTAEWVIGTTRGPSLVPVVTTGPVTAGALAGAVGQTGTGPLFGGRPVLNDWRSGLRVEAGVWLDADHRNGVSARFYSLFSVTDAFNARPIGATVVNLPQYTPTPFGTVQTPLFVAFPGATAGRVAASTRTSFGGGDLNFRHLLDRGDSYRVEVLAGYRQLHLSDELGATFDVTTTGIPLAAARMFGGDIVHTSDNFYGPQLGLYAATEWHRLTLEAHAAAALGATVSDLEFARSRTLVTAPLGVQRTTTAALVALGVPPATALALAPRALAANQFSLARAGTSNALTYLGVVGEGGGRLSWRATDHVRLTAGYSFIYWNNVRRAQEAFVSSPVLRSRAADFTTHLFSAGVDVRY